MKKKVLVLSLGRTNSLPLYAENIVSNFESLDFDILVSKNRSLKKPVVKSKEIITYSNKLSFFFNTLIYLPILILCLLPKIRKDYKALYLPYKHFWDLPFIFLFKFFNKEVIFTAHDGVLHKGERNWLTQSMNNCRLKMAKKVVYLTDYTRRHVERELGIVVNYEIVPHPIIENKFVEFNSKKDRTNNLLFLGRIDKYKGVELLMESAIILGNSFDKLIIAGKSLYDVNYSKHDKIEVLDKYLSEEEIGKLLSWADVLILPYTEATQSGVISLGIYAELPMVCTNVGGFSEQLAMDECFWCEPNSKSLVNAIIDSLDNQEKRNNIKKALIKKKSRLTWKNAAAQIEDLLI
ncbi:glycosyltransferase family 4 protein [Tamlana crocina]